MKPTYVYFIKPAGLDGPIKIGCSEGPPKRLVELGAWSPWPLELIGAVLGSYQDEQFLHGCFANIHSHREWFMSSPLLRGTIASIIAANSVDEVRAKLAPVGSIKKKQNRRQRTPGERLLWSFQCRIRNARYKTREAVGNSGAWYEPEDVDQIIQRWGKRSPEISPTEAEMARLEEYLANPAKHSIQPKWLRSLPAPEPQRVAS